MNSAKSLTGMVIFLLVAFIAHNVYRSENLPERVKLAELLENTGNSTNRFSAIPYGIDPCKHVVRDVSEDVRHLANKIQNNALSGSSPESLKDLAFLTLINGKPQEAIQILTKAVKLYPSDPYLVNDLAVAHVCSFEKHDSVTDLLSALDALDRLSQKASVPEATFNTASVLQKLFLEAQSRSAWQRYLAIDGSSNWAREAKKHIALLDLPKQEDTWNYQRQELKRASLSDNHDKVISIVAAFRQYARIYVEEEVLANWARAESERRAADVQANLKIAGEVGAALIQLNQDHMILNSLRAIERAKKESPQRLAALVSAHSEYAKGLQLFRNRNDKSAFETFSHSRDLFFRGQSPFASWAVVQMAVCTIYMRDYDVVIRGLSALGGSGDISLYPSLAARAKWISGLAMINVNEFAPSLLDYLQALDGFRGLGELENIAAVNFLVAENMRFQGRARESWSYRYAALAAATKVGRSRWLHNALFDSAEATLKQGLPNVAVYFQNEMIESPNRRTDEISLCESFLRRGKTHLKLAKIDKAQSDFVAAGAWLGRIGEVNRNAPLTADLREAVAESKLDINPEVAVGLLEDAISYYTSRRNYFRLPQLYYKRGLAFLRMRAYGQAEKEFEFGIRASEVGREDMPGNQPKISYFDSLQDIFDAMVKFQIATKNDSDAAFAYAERVRNRNLLEAIDVQSSIDELRSKSHINIKEISNNFPEGLALIEYYLLEDRLIIWVLKKDRFVSYDLDIEAGLIEENVARLVELLGAGVWGREGEELSRALYKILVGPVWLEIKNAKSVVFVPDKILNLVPFASLIDPDTGAYLIENTEVGVAPSAAIFGALQRRSRGLRGSAPINVLALGAPAIDRTLFPDLPQLGSARKEVSTVASFYSNKKILVGADATARAFLNAVPRYEVVHIAAHSISNPEYPEFSSLVLAKSLGEEGILYANKIRDTSLRNARLVVLASCRSSGGVVSASEGALSLVRPFLAAGALAVMGSLWNVEDNSASIMIREFHRGYSGGQSALAALRSAQLYCLRNRDASLRRPPSWAGFQVVGGAY